MKYLASDQQRQYWLLDQLVPNNSAYNIVSILEIEPSLNAQLFKQAFDKVLDAHPIYRTVYRLEDDGLYCHELSDVKPALKVVDDATLNRKQILDELQSFASEPFSLSEGPLFRASLTKADNGGWFLAMAVHHSVIDMHTRDLLASDISEAYNSLVKAGEVSFSHRENTYQEYATWYRSWLDSDAATREKAFWIAERPKMAEGFNFPYDYPRPSTMSLRGSIVDVKMASSTARKLESFARQQVAQPYLVLLTSYIALLKRYTGEDTITVGIPLTNRNRAEQKDAMGCFMNIVPVSVDIDDEVTFAQLLHKVRTGMLIAHRHQSLPFLQLVDAVNPKRDLSKNLIFQTLFTFQHPMKLTLDAVKATAIGVHPGGAQLDLSMSLWMSEEGVQGFFEYCTDLIGIDTANRFVDQFYRMVDAAMAKPDVSVSSISLLSPEEENRIVHQWNDTDHDYPSVDGLHQLLERQVERTPNAIALEMPGQDSLTYETFNRKCNQLAHYLVDNGIASNSRVGVYMVRSFEMVIALHAIEKAGAAYVPLEPEFPPERISQMIEDAEISVVISFSTKPPQLPASTQHIHIDAISGALADYPASNLAIRHSIEDDAYIIFTSGSTGRPKGVLNHQKGICNRIFWMQEAFKLSEKDVVLQKTPFTFDVSVWEFFWPFMCGAKLVVAPPNAHKDQVALCDLIGEYNITTIHFVPSMLDAFLGSPRLSETKSLQRIISSGEALSRSLENRCFEKLPHVELHNLYGPTEAAVDVTHWKCTNEETKASVPIGRAIANTKIYILDSHLNPTPIGVPGELHIGGVQVARGYVNRPELTSERFIPDPFSQNSADYLYKTGDLARFRGDGNIEYIGRMDGQVKLHGLRIELEEIDVSIQEEFPNIKQSLTIVSTGGADSRLVSYVVSANGEKMELAVLQEHLRKRLPSYMVPEQLIWLNTIPLSVNGKVDRKSLPDPETQFTQQAKGEKAGSDTESRICSIWEDLLKLDEVGVERNFFDVGGTSILAAHMVNRLNEAFGNVSSPFIVFQHPTIRELAQHIDNRDSGEDESEAQMKHAQDRAMKKKVAQKRKARMTKKR